MRKPSQRAAALALRAPTWDCLPLDVRYGRTSEARRTLDRLRANATEDRELELGLILLGAELAIALDDVDELRTVLRDAERARLRPGIQLDCLVAMALRMEADHIVVGRVGDPDREQVLRRIERLAQTAGASSVPFRRAMILTADAERTRLDGSAGRADAWADALAAWNRLRDSPYETSYCRMRLAIALAPDPASRGRVVALLEEGARVARLLGAAALEPVLATAHHLLAVPPAPKAVTTGGARALETLTRRVREVLLLAGRGLTNRRLARALVISEKTVGNHITNLFTKLGVSNRVQAANLLRRQGTVDDRKVSGEALVTLPRTPSPFPRATLLSSQTFLSQSFSRRTVGSCHRSQRLPRGRRHCLRPARRRAWPSTSCPPVPTTRGRCSPSVGGRSATCVTSRRRRSSCSTPRAIS